MPIFFASIVFPFAFTGITIILILRLGWPGVIGIIIPILVFPIQNYISKKNGQLLEKVNVNKDLRVKICTEIIEGIKFVKLYGWELAFKKMIQKYREKEINDYIWLSVGKSFERALGNSVAIWSGLAMFVTVHYVTGELSTALIFSTLELMVFLRLNMFFFSIGIGFLYELNVIFERFVNVFSIKNVQMIEIDPDTKKPIHQ